MKDEITLRDLFAGMALAGLLAAPSEPGVVDDRENSPVTAFKLADLMVAARKTSA